jgi:hypothetical protein
MCGVPNPGGAPLAAGQPRSYCSELKPAFGMANKQTSLKNLPKFAVPRGFLSTFLWRIGRESLLLPSVLCDDLSDALSQFWRIKWGDRLLSPVSTCKFVAFIGRRMVAFLFCDGDT